MTLLTLVPDAEGRWFQLGDKYGVPIDGQVKTILSEVDNIVTVEATFAVYGGIVPMPDNDLRKAFAAWGALSEENRRRFLKAVASPEVKSSEIRFTPLGGGPEVVLKGVPEAIMPLARKSSGGLGVR